MLPPVSEPNATWHRPAATAAAEPPDEPPGTRVLSSGFKTGPWGENSLDEPMANSSILTLPKGIAPCDLRLAIAVALYGETYESLSILDAQLQGCPLTLIRSFIAIGIPPKGLLLSELAASFKAVSLSNER